MHNLRNAFRGIQENSSQSGAAIRYESPRGQGIGVKKSTLRTQAWISGHSGEHRVRGERSGLVDLGQAIPMTPGVCG